MKQIQDMKCGMQVSKTGFWIIAVYLVSAISHSASASSGASFLKLGVGARAQGLGSAYTAIANDVTALHWNPAGLSQVQKKEVGAMHAELFADTRLDFVGYAHPMSKGTFGVGAVYLSQGAIDGRSADRTQTGDFNASDFAVTVGAGRYITRRTSLGANLKLIQSKIAGYSSTGFAIDAGTLYHHDSLPLTLGFALQNLGPSMTFLNESYNLPLTLASGASYMIADRFTISADLKQQVYDSRTSFSVGTEYSPVNMIALRAGYLTNAAKATSRPGSGFSDKLSEMSGLGLGLGLKLGSSTIDYSFTPAGELGNSQRISIGIMF